MLFRLSVKSVVLSLKVRFLIYIIRYIKSEGRASLTQPSLILRLCCGVLSPFLRRSQSVPSAFSVRFFGFLSPFLWRSQPVPSAFSVRFFGALSPFFRRSAYRKTFFCGCRRGLVWREQSVVGCLEPCPGVLRFLPLLAQEVDGGGEDSSSVAFATTLE